MSEMETQLQQWIEENLSAHPGIVQPETLKLDALDGDAGFRRYYRLNTRPTLLATMSPESDGISESANHFAGLAGQLLKQGIPVPQIVDLHPEKNFLLQEDFGNRDFLSVLTDESVELLYGEALMVLSRIQQVPRATVNVGDYSRDLLQAEMNLFPQWLLENLLSYRLSETEKELLATTFKFLEDEAMSQPRCLVHRDYHSRNLMYREGEAPGVIDFQDAVWGPVTYDLVSLLRDCYIRWTPDQVERWMMGYGNLAIEMGIIPVTGRAQWKRWFDTMGLQRHIKVLGIFSRLFLRDKKARYLQDLPLVIRYTLETANQYEETKPFAEWMQETLLPEMKKQPWYRDFSNAGDRE